MQTSLCRGDSNGWLVGWCLVSKKWVQQMKQQLRNSRLWQYFHLTLHQFLKHVSLRIHLVKLEILGDNPWMEAMESDNNCINIFPAAHSTWILWRSALPKRNIRSLCLGLGGIFVPNIAVLISVNEMSGISPNFDLKHKPRAVDSWFCFHYQSPGLFEVQQLVLWSFLGGLEELMLSWNEWKSLTISNSSTS